MDVNYTSAAVSMPPLPDPLGRLLAAETARVPKRERTRRQLIASAIQVFSARGVAAATMQEIAASAGMATATVYNHFETKEALLQAVTQWVADTLCRLISESSGPVADGAERMAIGNRRYLWLAEQSPAWTLLLLDLFALAPQIRARIQEYVRADLRLGIRQKRFRVASEASAMDLISGTIAQGMRSIALGLAPAGHDVAIATTVLRGLGMDHREAAEVARRPLPAFAPGDANAAGPVRRARGASPSRSAL